MTDQAIPLIVVTLVPSHITPGWWFIYRCTGKSRRPIAFATSYSTALKSGAMLASRLNARFAPVGRVAQ